MQLCSWPDEVFLLLVYESQGKRGCCAVNAKSGLRSRSCLWLWGKTFLAYLFLLFIVSKGTVYGCSGYSQPLKCLVTGSAVTVSLPSPMLWLLEFWQGAWSPSFVLAATLSLSLSWSHQLSRRRIASSHHKTTWGLWVLCNCPFHSLRLRRVTDCWLRVSEWLLAYDRSKFQQ